MIAATEKLFENKRNASGNRRLPEPEPVGKSKSRTGATGTQEERVNNIPSLQSELEAVRREQTKLQQAIYEAAQLQRKLCAPRELVCGQFEIAGEIFPVRHLSGDFFKVMQLDSVLALAVGDIAGKGLTAGIWQAYLMGLIQRCARKHCDPAEAVAEVNQELCQDQDEAPLTAVFFGRLDPQRNDVVYCNAGLPAPLLLKQKGNVERLEVGGPMLGAVKEATFLSGRVQLNPGDMLIAYSDGVTECRNAHEEEFEIERLSAAANAVNGGSASQALFSTLAAVLDFADACSPADDLTLLVVRRREAAVKRETTSRAKGFLAPRGAPATLVRAKKGDRRGNASKSLN